MIYSLDQCHPKRALPFGLASVWHFPSFARHSRHYSTYDSFVTSQTNSVFPRSTMFTRLFRSCARPTLSAPHEPPSLIVPDSTLQPLRPCDHLRGSTPPQLCMA